MKNPFDSHLLKITTRDTLQRPFLCLITAGLTMYGVTAMAGAPAADAQDP